MRPCARNRTDCLIVAVAPLLTVAALYLAVTVNRSRVSHSCNASLGTYASKRDAEHSAVQELIARLKYGRAYNGGSCAYVEVTYNVRHENSLEHFKLTYCRPYKGFIVWPHYNLGTIDINFLATSEERVRRASIDERAINALLDDIDAHN